MKSLEEIVEVRIKGKLDVHKRASSWFFQREKGLSDLLNGRLVGDNLWKEYLTV